jgi:uncharacterized membrane protein
VKRLTAAGVTVGAILSAIGFVVVGSTVGQQNPHETRMLGLLLISFGALIAALVFYLDARKIQESQFKKSAASRQNDARLRCFVCGAPAVTMRCEKHKARLCPDCISQHDEPQCFYVPLSRFQKGN